MRTINKHHWNFRFATFLPARSSTPRLPSASSRIVPKRGPYAEEVILNFFGGVCDNIWLREVNKNKIPRIKVLPASQTLMKKKKKIVATYTYIYAYICAEEGNAKVVPLRTKFNLIT